MNLNLNPEDKAATIKFEGEILMELFRLESKERSRIDCWLSYAVARMGTCIRADTGFTDDAIIGKAREAFKNHVENGVKMDEALTEMNEFTRAS